MAAAFVHDMCYDFFLAWYIVGDRGLAYLTYYFIVLAHFVMKAAGRHRNILYIQMLQINTNFRLKIKRLTVNYHPCEIIIGNGTVAVDVIK